MGGIDLDLNDILRFGKKAIKAGAPILGNALGGPAGGLVAEVVMGDNDIDSKDPNAWDKLNEKLMANNAVELKKYEMDHAERIAKIDREIRVTEAMVDASKAQLGFDKAQIQSEDKYVSRQRPTTMYGMLLGIMANVAANVYGALSIPDYTLWWLPSYYFTLFGAGFLGYSYLRTKEKKNEDPVQGVMKNLLGGK